MDVIDAELVWSNLPLAQPAGHAITLDHFGLQCADASTAPCAHALYRALRWPCLVDSPGCWSSPCVCAMRQACALLDARDRQPQVQIASALQSETSTRCLCMTVLMDPDPWLAWLGIGWGVTDAMAAAYVGMADRASAGPLGLSWCLHPVSFRWNGVELMPGRERESEGGGDGPPRFGGSHVPYARSVDGRRRGMRCGRAWWRSGRESGGVACRHQRVPLVSRPVAP